MDRHKQIATVLQILRPKAEWDLTAEVLVWLDKVQTRPTDKEIEDAIANLDKLNYKEMRATEYPSVGDQLDALWKLRFNSLDSDALTIQKQVIAVKEKYPKP